MLQKDRISTLWWTAVLIGICSRGAAAAEIVACDVQPNDLRCDYLLDPNGIDSAQPRLSWKLAPTDPKQRGQSQTAWRVVVASGRELLDRDQGDLWDSGRVESDQSVHVPYQGQSLESRMRCWWKVRVWDGTNRPSAWSLPAFWSMGLLKTAEWRGAEWIGLDEADDEGIPITDIQAANWLSYPEGDATHNAPTETRYYRRTLDIPAEQQIRRAICFFAGDDVCSFYVNGAQIGVGRGHPNLVGIDVTGQLHSGANELAVLAANLPADVPNNPGGWIGAVRVEFEQGPALVIHSDRRWKCAKEVGDGWETGKFSESHWLDARELGKAGIAPWGMPWKDRWQSEHRTLPGRYLRREFQVARNKAVKHAMAYVCGLGFFDLHVNGRVIGDKLMNPALTGYDKRALYVTFDVTEDLQAGGNAVGVVLSNGRFFAPRLQSPVPMHSYGYPKMLLQMHIEYDDGTQQTIVSDRSWKLTTEWSAAQQQRIRRRGIRCAAGNARLGRAPGSTIRGGSAAQVVDAAGRETRSADDRADPGHRSLRAGSHDCNRSRASGWSDFGQAFYGVVRLKASGPPGLG